MRHVQDSQLDMDALAARAAEEAARWLAALSDERCEPAERECFLQWLCTSRLHVEEFLRLSTLAKAASRRELWPQDSIESLVAAARASDANVTELAVQRRQDAPPRRRRGWLAAAAAAVAALGLAWGIAPRLGLFAPTYVTAIGEQRSITLEDGSVVELNSRSRLRAHFTADLRAVHLSDGEAIFRVAKDADRPFRVRTGATDIVALGTAFNVNATRARTVVTVLEGRVRVAQRARPSKTQDPESLDLQPGEQVIVTPEVRPILITLDDTEKVTSWTERRLIFEETDIAAAAQAFARYSARRIRIEHPEIAARKITGVFDATDPRSLVQFLATDDDVLVREDAQGWVVTRR